MRSHSHILHGTTHHWAACNYLARIFGNAARSLDNIGQRRAKTHKVVARTLHAWSRHGHHTFDERFVFLHRLVNSKHRSDILHHCAHRNRQCAARHLSTNGSVDQLFFSALRIVHFKRTNLYSKMAIGQFLEQRDSVFFVCLYADNGAFNLQGTHQQRDANENFVAVFHHQLMVASEVRFALHCVHYQHFGFVARRWHQLDMRWEASAAQAHNASIFYLVDDLLRLEFANAIDVVGAIDIFRPTVAIAFSIDVDCRHGLSPRIDGGIDFRHHARNWRMHIGRHKTAALRNELSHFHAIAFGNDGLRWCANMLTERHDGLFWQRHALNGNASRNFVIVWVNTTHSKCLHILKIAFS